MSIGYCCRDPLRGDRSCPKVEPIVACPSIAAALRSSRPLVPASAPAGSALLHADDHRLRLHYEGSNEGKERDDVLRLGRRVTEPRSWPPALSNDVVCVGAEQVI